MLRQAMMELITCQLQTDEAHAAALADGHGTISPTHLVRDQSNNIIGCVSVGAVPLLFMWMDTRRALSFQSHRTLKESEEISVKAGHKQICLPCSLTSPFHKLLPRLGYQPLTPIMQLHVKNLCV
jgi:hypothetical protein